MKNLITKYLIELIFIITDISSSLSQGSNLYFLNYRNISIIKFRNNLYNVGLNISQLKSESNLVLKVVLVFQNYKP